MPLNLPKKYSTLLDLAHLPEHKRTESLYSIFKRDIEENTQFKFQSKQIWPVKKDGVDTMQTLFNHLTRRDVYEDGKKTGARSFEMARSQRLHWIKTHIEGTGGKIDVFSYKDRIRGKDIIRTYIHDPSQDYIIILEPLKTGDDYYLLSAYYLNEPGGKDQINTKSKKRLPKIY
ncbi:MAG: hypothetical protein K0S26_1413 [Bacteroidota bacterium]|jgi:hypothetical protein|nr:hypothetical protein [Bacteroidota bacterium]